MSANISTVQDLADRNRDLIQKGFDELMKRQDTVLEQTMKALEAPQQIGECVHELVLKQAQVMQGASEDQTNRIASSLDQDLVTIPFRPNHEMSPSVFTALEDRSQHIHNDDMEAIVAFW